MPATRSTTRLTPAFPRAAFSETAAWARIGAGWKQLFGSFAAAGLSFEWHEFDAAEDVDWGQSFHPASVELCLNLCGEGRIVHSNGGAVLNPLTVAFYSQGGEPFRAVRSRGQRHQFITVEFSFAFLREHLASYAGALHPGLKSVLDGADTLSWTSGTMRMGARQQQLLQSLREPPIFAAAQPLWYRTKALELATEFFFGSADGSEFFCQRQKRVASHRVERVLALLRRDLINPPTLEDLGKTVGCSQFHLSRTFSAEMGMSIPQYIRRLRMERAGELLKSGKYNVTEVAMEVGYSSLSHFSTAFHQTFGCCPGLYPLAIKDPVPASLAATSGSSGK